MDIKSEIKAYLAMSNWTLTDVAKELSIRYNKNYTVQNLNNKIANETLRYKELLHIADIIGYKIEWIKKETCD